MPRAPLFGSIDPNNLKKRDNRTVRIGLKYGDVSLYDTRAKNSMGIVPTDYDPKKPVGTGAF